MEILKTIGIIVLVILLLPVILKLVLGILGITVGLMFLGVRVAVTVLVIYLVYRGIKAMMNEKP